MSQDLYIHACSIDQRTDLLNRCNPAEVKCPWENQVVEFY